MNIKNKARLIIIFGVAILIILIFFLNNFKKQNQPNANVILIVIDSLRPDHLGCYGYKRNTSPNIDKLATEGVTFTQAVCQIPDTQPSVLSFLTSTSPALHYRDHPRDWTYLNPATKSLAEILKKNRYCTGLITDQPYLFRIYGLKDDFDTYFETATNNPKKLTNAALGWIKKNKKRPLFLYLHYFGPHTPYDLSLPYSKIYLNDKYNGADIYVPIAKDNIEDLNGDIKDSLGFIPRHVAEKNITNANYYICKYAGKIRTVDEQIGLLLEGIKKLGLDKKTLVILIADHGESLGEHHLYFQHVYTLYDELIKVPLIIKYNILIPENRVIKHQVQLIDVMPTVLDILGIKDNNCYMEGISLLPFILERNYPERYAFGVANCGINNIVKYFIRTESWKLIYEDYQEIKKIYPNFKPTTFLQMKNNFPKVYELYSLKEDPYELHNLVDEEKDTFHFLKHKLDEYVIRVEKQADEGKELANMYLESNTIKPLDKETKDKLKSLGYIQ